MEISYSICLFYIFWQKLANMMTWTQYMDLPVLHFYVQYRTTTAESNRSRLYTFSDVGNHIQSTRCQLLQFFKKLETLCYILYIITTSRTRLLQSIKQCLMGPSNKAELRDIHLAIRWFHSHTNPSFFCVNVMQLSVDLCLS